MTKKFTDMTNGDRVYVLVDPWEILGTTYNGGTGFANKNYGLVMASMRVDRVRETRPTKRRPVACEFKMLGTIESEDPNVGRLFPYGREEGTMCVPPEANESGILKRTFGRLDSKGMIFTTKEALCAYVGETTDSVEKNLARTCRALEGLI